eukprot:302588-Rhodomonas_salina.1
MLGQYRSSCSKGVAPYAFSVPQYRTSHSTIQYGIRADTSGRRGASSSLVHRLLASTGHCGAIACSIREVSTRVAAEHLSVGQYRAHRSSICEASTGHRVATRSTTAPDAHSRIR